MWMRVVTINFMQKLVVKGGIVFGFSFSYIFILFFGSRIHISLSLLLIIFHIQGRAFILQPYTNAHDTCLLRNAGKQSLHEW